MALVPAFGDGEVLISMAVITGFDGSKAGFDGGVAAFDDGNYCRFRWR